MKLSSKAVLMEKRDEAIDHLMDDPTSESWTLILQLSLRKIAELNAKKPLMLAHQRQDETQNKLNYESSLPYLNESALVSQVGGEKNGNQAK